MPTQLGAYSGRFDAMIRPVLAPLERAIAALAAADADVPGKALHGPLRELRHQAQALCDKVQEQQAYVLLFGPLKSGKSTLINALAGAYVSEVSSLPAYPCIVFVGAGARREYLATRYDGSTQTWTDAQEFARDLAAAHVELAAALRAAEQKGLAFEPQERFPQAIRRVDVRVPDSALAAAGAVLVDTPGLYTRMRFGYDRMTREFRNAAACAVFVVRSDTLFLEQAFAEFHQLLDLFSRVFLVVNVDSHKRDLSPDGKLVPSLEQTQPERVLQAFEALAMTPQLQAAAAAGRLRLHACDLQRAASWSLQRADGAPAPADFAAFESELRGFLGSAEYLAAFLRDSLQRARSLLSEAGILLAGADVQRLRQRLAEHDERVGWTGAEEQRLQAALAVDLAPAFAPITAEVALAAANAARDAGARLLRGLGASIDTWFLSGHSLQTLQREHWQPLVREYRAAAVAVGRAAVEAALSQAQCGLALPTGVAELLRRAGIDARAVLLRSLERLGATTWPDGEDVPVDVAAIPLRRTFADVVAFRSGARVRERTFGPAAAPDARIPAAEKAARLGEQGRLHLHQCVARLRAGLQTATETALRQHFGERFATAGAAALRDALAPYGPALREERARHEAARARLQGLALPLRALAVAAHEVLPQVGELGRAFGVDVAGAPPRPVLVPTPPRAEAPLPS